jgi:hypothetical protein
MTESLTYSDYWNHIDAMAREIVTEVVTQGESVWALTDEIYQAVDGDSWVIYTHRALALLRHSQNDDALFAHGMSLDGCESASDVYTTLAHYAMLEDLSDRVNRIVDEECSECDECASPSEPGVLYFTDADCSACAAAQ